MITASLDQIARRGLLENSLPIHWYLEFLIHSQTCLRELNFDTLKIVNAFNTPVDDQGSFYLPDDFVEDVAVCIPGGQRLFQLPHQDWITPLRIHDSVTGQFDTYANQTSTSTDTFFGYPLVGTVWFWNFNSFGEPTGGFYGANAGTRSGYTVLKQQRRIQLSEGLIGTNVVLLYVGDGSSIDNATQIDPQAFSTINSFIQWKRSPNRDNKDSPEGRNFYNERRKLVARLNPLTVTDIRNTLHNAYQASIKN